MSAYRTLGPVLALLAVVLPPHLSIGAGASYYELDDNRRSGGFTRSFPLELPPAKLRPSIAATYTTQGQAGLFGQGTTLSGLPTIRRVNETGIKFSPDDAFSLTGGVDQSAPRASWLRPGTGAADTFYSETFDGRRWQAIPGSYGTAGNPTYWVMNTPSGLTYYFGGDESENSDGQAGQATYGGRTYSELWNWIKLERRTVADPVPGDPATQNGGVVEWLLYKVVDLDGNEYRVEHLVAPDGSGAIVPSRVVFNQHATVNSPLTPYTVDFVYNFQVDPLVQRIPGPMFSAARIDTINIFVGAASLSSYVFDRVSVPELGADVLQQIRQVKSGGTVPEATVTLDWPTQTSLDDVTLAHPVAISPSAFQASSDKYKTLSGDLNGDGYEDLVRVETGVSAARKFQWIEGDAMGLASVVETIHEVTRYYALREDDISIADINGDGIDDIVCVNFLADPGQNNSTIAEVRVAYGGITGPVGGFTTDATIYLGYLGQNTFDPERMRSYLFDSNDDQRPDLLITHDMNESFSVRNEGGGIGAHFTTAVSAGNLGVESYFREGVWHEQGGTTPRSNNSLVVIGYQSSNRTYIRDFSGDRRTDICFHLETIITYQDGYGVFAGGRKVKLGCFYGAANGQLHFGGWKLYEHEESANAGLGEAFWPNHEPSQSMVGDFNGDGVWDLAYLSADVLEWEIEVHNYVGVCFAVVPFPCPREWHEQVESQRLGFQLEVFEGTATGLDFSANNGTSVTTWESNAQDSHPIRSGGLHQTLAADVSGDGRSDFVYIYQNRAKDEINVWVADVYDGAFAWSGTAAVTEVSNPLDHTFVVSAADFDGDGRQDLGLLHHNDAASELFVLQGSQEEGLVNRADPSQTLLTAAGIYPFSWRDTSTGDLYPTSAPDWLVSDFNADGRADVLVFNREGNPPAGAGAIRGALSDPAIIREVTAVENGLGGRLELEFKRLPSLPGAIDPAQIPSGMAVDTRRSTVLYRETSDNAHGLRSSKRYAYAGKLRKLGDSNTRYDAGFTSIDTIQEETNNISRSSFYTERELVGAVLRKEAYVWSGNGDNYVLVKEVDNLYQSSHTPFSLTTRMPLLKQESVKTYELDHPHPETWTEIARRYDDYGNLTTAETTLVDPDSPGQTTRYVYQADYATSSRLRERWLNHRVERTATSKSLGASVHQLLDARVYRYPADYEPNPYRVYKAYRPWVSDISKAKCTFIDIENPEIAGICIPDPVSGETPQWRVIAQVDPDFDPYGNPKTSYDAKLNQTHYSMKTENPSLMASVTNDLGHSLTFQYEASGQPRRVTEPAGTHVEYNYDGYGRLDTMEDSTMPLWLDHQQYSSNTPGDYRVHSYTRQNKHNYIAVTHEHLDGFGTPWKSVQSTDYGDFTTETQTYWDLAALTTRVSVASDSAADRWIEQWHDRLGRVQQVVETVASAGQQGRGSVSVQRTLATLEYSRGQVLERDAEGSETVNSYDYLRRVDRVRQPDGDEIRYSYNDADLVGAVWLPGLNNKQVITYDSWGRVTSYEVVREDDPSPGRIEYEYDWNGNRTKLVRANGTQIDYVYDSIDRLKQVIGAGVDADYYYDSPKPGVLDRVVVWQDRASASIALSRDYDYDDRGNVIRLTEFNAHRHPSQGANFVAEFDYDYHGRLTEARLPSGEEVHYSYYTDGSMKSVDYRGSSGQPLERVVHYAYNARGQLRFADAWDGSLTNYAYDADFNLDGYDVIGRMGTQLANVHYDYDSVDRVAAIEDRLAGLLDATYSYDARGRLTSASNVASSDSYSYDALGNIETKRGVTVKRRKVQFGGSTTWTVDVTDSTTQLPVAKSWYDEAGVRTREERDTDGDGVFDQAFAYFYNAHQQLIRVQDGGGNVLLEYAYDHNLQPVWRRYTDQGQPYESVFLADGIVEEHTQTAVSGGVSRTLNIEGVSGLVSTINTTPHGLSPSVADMTAMAAGPYQEMFERGPPSGRYVHHRDRLGSVSFSTEVLSQTVVNQNVLYPYGEVQSALSAGLAATREQFTAFMKKDELGLQLNGWRHYDPLSGMYLTPDAIQPSHSRPEGMNGYLYAFGNPTNLVDPLGFEPKEPGGPRLDPCYSEYGCSYYHKHPVDSGVSDAGWAAYRAQRVQESGASPRTNDPFSAFGHSSSGRFVETTAVVGVTIASFASPSGPGAALVTKIPGAVRLGRTLLSVGSKAKNLAGPALSAVGRRVSSLAGRLTSRFRRGPVGSSGSAVGGVGQGSRFITNAAGRTLDLRTFQGLTRNPGIVKLGRGGGGKQLIGPANSYSLTNGGHALVYGPGGRIVYDVSAKRIKAFRWNQAPNGQWFSRSGSNLKFNEVPQAVLAGLGL